MTTAQDSLEQLAAEIGAIDAKLGRYRYWGDQKPDTDRPLLTLTRPCEAVTTAVQDALGDSGASQPLGSVGTLRIYGPIDSWGGYWGVSAKDVARALDFLGDVDTVVVRVNSPGGESFEGRAIMNLLRAHSARCVAIVDGLAASAASYVAVGCDETVMAPGTMLMIHDTHMFVYGPSDDLRKAADIADSITRAGSELYADVAGGTADQWRELQRAETWYTASEAVASGLADRVGIVPDAGPAETAADEAPAEVDPEVEDRVDAEYDLSIFTYAGREQAPAPKPPTASAGGSTPSQGTESAVAFSDEQMKTMRQDLGLPEDADEATITAALTEALNERADAPAETTTPKVPEGMVLVDSEVLTELRTGAEAGRTARQQLDDQARDSAIEGAIRAGKTTPARREHWVSSWKADPQGTKDLLDSLEPGLAVPIEEDGDGDKPETELNINDAELEAFASQFGLTKEDLRG